MAAIHRFLWSSPSVSKHIFIPFFHFPNSVFSSFTSTTVQTTFHRKPLHKSLSFSLPPASKTLLPTFRTLTAKSNSSLTNSPAAFEFSDSDGEQETQKQKPKQIDKSKLPPPYDPFRKKPVVEEPKDPKDLQEIFHKMRTEGLTSNAIKMFDALSKDGLTHEALELFGQIKDKGNMPDVVAHTAVIEAYANAGQSKEAHKVFIRMLASGVKPNAYTYTVLIKGLSRDGKIGDAKKYVIEMMDKGIQPNAGTYTAVFEAFARDEKLDEGREFFEQIKGKGFVADEKAVRENLSKQRGQVYRGVMNLLFGK